MAKNDGIISTFAQLIHIATACWFREWNVARQSGDYGKTEDLRNSMHLHGWMKSGDGQLEVEVCPPAFKERAMRERQEKWDNLKAVAKADSAKLVDLQTFEEIYLDKGKLREVQYIGLTGNRRSDVYFPAMVLRKKDNEPITVEIPVVIKSFKNDLERLESQILENEGKSIGFLEMSSVDKLKAAKTAVEFGANQARLRKTFKDGTGQKLWGVLQLNKRYPALNIFSRMCLPADAEGHIRFGNQNKEELAKLVLRSDPEALAEKNRTLALSGNEQLTPTNQDQVAEYFNTVKVGKNEDKIMPRDEIKGQSVDFPVLCVRNGFKGIMQNTTEPYKKYHAVSEAYNALDTLLDQGDLPLFSPVLLAVEATPTALRGELIKRLLAAVAPVNGPAAKPELITTPAKK